MARRRSRRYRRKSGRWAPNIVKISNQYTVGSGEWFATETLAENPVQANTGVSQTFTAKNFEITFTLEVPELLNSYNEFSNDIEAVTAFIMFVPQGMQVTSSYYAEHPEYILNYKYLGSPGGRDVAAVAAGNLPAYGNQQYQPYKIRSRLSRKLQTGDRIILYLQGSNENDSLNRIVSISGIIRWWSKAN